MNTKSTIYIMFFAIVGIVILAGCTPIGPDNTNLQPNNNTSSGNTQNGGLLKFNSVAELNTFLTENSQNQNSGGGLGVMMDSRTKAVSQEAGTSAPSAAPTTANGAADYSQTNVQVSGVDEADFVKNDGKYIYMIQSNKLLIINALDPKNSDIISTTDLPKNYYASNIFLYGDKLIVLAQSNEQSYYFRKYDIMPQPNYEPLTKVMIYDVSNRKDPTVSKELSVSGDYFQSRMIDNIVYLVAVKYAQTPVRPPIIYAADTKITPNIYYFDNNEESYNYNTIMSVDVNTESVVDSQVYLLGYSNTMMMSQDNIYIAYQKQPYRCWGFYCRNSDYDRARFVDVVVPLLQGTLKTDVQNILNSKASEDEQWNSISDVLDTFYKDVENDPKLQDQYDSMISDISSALDEYDTKQLLEKSKTIIHKIAVNNGKLSYVAKGEVDGRLLNQYSLDESNGYLRLATTIDLWTNTGRRNYNNVYVLNKNMGVAGKLEKLANNESIYATRFVGDKLYMVTFRQIDPFFVIDLSDPTSPKVLGRLKIPGYSSYLHPISDNLILGIGKETGTNEWGGVTTQGVKISLYDVSDFEHPKEVTKYEIGMAGSDSPILYDPKAFLYSATKGIFVVPISEVTAINKAGYVYDYRYWDGAYVFKISNNGFELLGKVKHDSRSSSYYNWWDQASVTRSLYMDDALYTISNKYIKVNDLADNLSSLNTIDLPNEQNYPIMYSGGVVAETVVAK